MRPPGGRTGCAYKPRAVDKEKESHWRKVFARFNRSELPFRKFCVQENISPNTFQYWRRELRKRDEARGITSTITKGDNRPSNLQQNVDYWLGIINEINAYEGSVRSYCHSHSIASGTLHFWEKRLRDMKLTKGVRKHEQKSDSVFVPVRILDDCSQPPEGKSCGSTAAGMFQRIEITLGDGVVMSLPVSTGVEVLIQLINGVKEHRC
jgi:transposase-like protein